MHEWLVSRIPLTPHPLPPLSYPPLSIRMILLPPEKQRVRARSDLACL